MAASQYRRLSLWHDTIDDDWTPRPTLDGDTDVDIAIVGAGYTGLWTAYWLSEFQPDARIIVIDSQVAGFGASGRNGGWCSALFPTSLRRLASASSRADAIALQRAMNETVPHIGRIIAKEGIDCDFAHGGYVSMARNKAHLARARAEVKQWRSWGFGADDVELLTAEQTRERVGATDILGGTFFAHCAALHPAKLVRGLAQVVQARGVRICELTEATRLSAGEVRTAHGRVRADVVVRATEGYTPLIPGMQREIVPMYSLMVATEPLPSEILDGIGLTARSTFSDKRHLRIYGQRTADGRIAFGGRGAPYHFGSKVEPGFDLDERVHDMLRNILRQLFPALAGARFTHAWGGNLGIPRDWFPSVRFDRRTGTACAGGYVGDGVATAEIAGRTLADLILARDTDLVRLPWVNHNNPRWEPEPLRWLGVNAVTALFAGADISERRTGRPSKAAAGFWRALGH